MSEPNLLKSLDYSVLQQCMHCGMCLPTCPTYDETKFERSSPRGRIRLMREVADGRLEVTPTFAEEMSYCLGCLACQTACPAGVDYATLLENARGEVERRRVVGGLGRRFMRWITLSVLFRHPRLLRWFGRSLWISQKLGVQRAVRALGIPRLLPRRLRLLEAMTPTVRAPWSNKRIAPSEAPRSTWPSFSETRVGSFGETAPRYRVALLTGCVQDLLYGHINRATADVLLANGCEVVTPPVQFCCGSLHAHNGELELARDLARKNLDLYDLAQLDAVISNAGGCGSHLKKYGELLDDDLAYRERAREWDCKVRDVHEWLVEIGFRAPGAGRPGSLGGETTVTYDASCHLLHGQKVAAQPVALLRVIPGLRLVPLAESDWCCGAAGVYSITQPEQSAKLLARKLDHIAATGATVLASGNPGCLLQLEMGMRRDGRLRGVRACHPVELLAEAYAAETSAPPARCARTLLWCALLVAGPFAAARFAAGEPSNSPTTSPPQSTPAVAWPDAQPLSSVPEWAVDAVFYQIFPERFCNGDPKNDPTPQSLEDPRSVPHTWRTSPWTGDWYARAAWEKSLGGDFYEHGVFNRRYGGDLAGVFEKLDYLADLGVNAIYFNPVFYGRSLHKYDGASMHHIDPCFGPDPTGDLELIGGETSDPATWQWTAADEMFLNLLSEAHRRGVRVIIDGVFNHTGRDFFAFQSLRDQQALSPYRDWYIVARFDDPATPANEFQYKGWSGHNSLPAFADNASGDDLHPGPRQYVMNITRRWMDPDGDGDPADGVDGWRLDVAGDVPVKFWRDWNARVRELNPQAYTVAEVWNDAREFLVGGGFSATMNYHAFAFPVKGFLMDGRLSAHDFGRELELRRLQYPPAMQFALQNLVDSHDTDRLASMIVNCPGEDELYLQAGRFDFDVRSRVSPRHDKSYDVRKPNDRERRIQRLVVLLQMTYLGAPMVYYGDEAGMWGGDDPCDRAPMVWDDLAYEPQTAHPWGRPRQADAVVFDRELFEFYRDAIALRRDHAALRRGSFEPVATDDDAKFFVFRRTLGGKSIYVALHRGDGPRDYAWTLPDPSESLEVLFSTDAPIRVESESTGRRVVLPALSGVVLGVAGPHDAAQP